VFYRVCAEWGPTGVGRRDSLFSNFVARLVLTQRVSTIAIIGATQTANVSARNVTFTRTAGNATVARTARLPRRTCDTFPPAIKMPVRGSATRAITTTLEVDVITELVQILRQFLLAPTELQRRERADAQGKI
jgi:hypothetical protein